MHSPRFARSQELWQRQLAIWLAFGCLVLGSLAADTPNTDEQYRRLVLGTWQDDYQGRRTMTLRSDGTGTMLVELRGWKAALYASRLRFDMIWSLENGRLKKKTTGGDPPGKVKTILRMMGDQVNERILELSLDSLILLDQDGKKRYHWRRAEPSP